VQLRNPLPRLIAPSIALAILAGTSNAGAAEVSGDAPPIPVLPTSPAFEAIGANPTTVTRPATIRSLGTELMNTFDAKGHFKPGLAIEAAPLWLAFGHRVTLANWRGSYGERALSRFAISFASTAGANGVTAVSQGLRFVLADDADPRWDRELESCISKALTPVGGPPTNPEEAAGTDVTIKKNDAIAACKQAAAERAGIGNSAAVSVAVTEEQPGDGGRTKFGKFLGWLAGGVALGGGSTSRDWLYVMGSGRYTYSRLDSFTELALGAKVRVGGASYGFAIDGAWTPRRALSDDAKWQGRAFVVGANAELRLTETTWISATMGFNLGVDAPAQGLFSLLNLKYALAGQRTIAAP